MISNQESLIEFLAQLDFLKSWTNKKFQLWLQ